MNILFTCAGRRNYLLQYFKTIEDVRVIACDASLYAPAFYEADEYFIVPEIFEPDYIGSLLNEGILRGIDAIIPLNDLELPLLSQVKDLFKKEGINIIISSPEVIDTCFDKIKTVEFSKSLTIKTVPTFRRLEDVYEYKKNFPDSKFVIKPRWGTASAGIEYPQDNDELCSLFNILKRRYSGSFRNPKLCSDDDTCIIIQKKLEGIEYGIDVINDLKGNYKASLLRRKIAMRSGETDKAETIYDDRLFAVGEQIGKSLKHIGIVDCDVIIENKDIYLLEINPRFGGGYPFSHFAGANVPAAYISWLRNSPISTNYFNYNEGVIAAKTDSITKVF